VDAMLHHRAVEIKIFLGCLLLEAPMLHRCQRDPKILFRCLVMILGLANISANRAYLLM
jgi:hypothetical protein